MKLKDLFEGRMDRDGFLQSLTRFLETGQGLVGITNDYNEEDTGLDLHSLHTNPETLKQRAHARPVTLSVDMSYICDMRIRLSIEGDNLKVFAQASAYLESGTQERDHTAIIPVTFTGEELHKVAKEVDDVVNWLRDQLEEEFGSDIADEDTDGEEY